MFERFTKRARSVVEDAAAQARESGDAAVGADHPLLAVLRDPDCLAVRVLGDLGVPAADLHATVVRLRGDRRRGALTEGDVQALRAIGIDVEEVLRSVEQNLGADLGGDEAGPAARMSRPRRLTFTADSRKVLELALREAIALKHGSIGTEHLLLGLLRLDHGVAADALAGTRLTHRAVRAAIVDAWRATG